MFCSVHIWIKRLFTSLALLLRLSFLGTISDINTLLSWDFILTSCSLRTQVISPAMQNNMVLIKISAGFTRSCMHLTFAELNGRTLKWYLWLSFLVNKKPFNFFTMLSPSMNTVSSEFCDGNGEVTLSLLLVLFLLLLFFQYYYYYHYCY